MKKHELGKGGLLLPFSVHTAHHSGLEEVLDPFVFTSQELAHHPRFNQEKLLLVAQGKGPKEEKKEGLKSGEEV